MAILDIINVPDPLLKTTSKTVDAVTDELRKLMDDMLQTMYIAPGIGLAAIQVGVAKRVIVVDVAEIPENPEEEPIREPKCLVNPEVIWESPEHNVFNEGCLSVPDHYADVERPISVKIRYLDYDGQKREERMEGLLATVVQHEIDHLNGIVFIDYLSKLKRSMIVKKVQKADREKADA